MMSMYFDRNDQCKCVNDIDSPAVHEIMSEELKKKNINQAWLPLKKVTFYDCVQVNPNQVIPKLHP